MSDQETNAGPVGVGSPLLSVVIPVFGNQDSLRELNRRLVAALEGISYELIFVEDHSPDSSLTVLRELAADDEHITVVALYANVGQNRALLAGLSYASGRYAAFLDADLQDPPEILPKLLAAALAQGSDAFFAVRGGRYESLSRHITSRMFKWAQHHLSGVPRGAGLFALIDSSLREKLVKADPPFLVPAIGMTAVKAAALTFIRAPRPTGQSSYTARQRLKIGLSVIGWTIRARLSGSMPSAHPPLRKIANGEIIGIRRF